jgi:hypothetical protein
MRASMFVEDPPPFDDIIAAVRKFEETFNRE